ncbi:uncharacterized protein DS421_1g12490 [Arachis hypogaea]|nr:uncharacterized protein DS421_1g12490 [Arachis hypogaea]
MIQTQKHSFIHRLHIPNKMLNKMLLVTLTLNRCNSWFLLYSRRSIPSLFVFLPTRFVVLFLCSSLLWFVVLVRFFSSPWFARVPALALLVYINSAQRFLWWWS